MLGEIDPTAPLYLKKLMILDSGEVELLLETPDGDELRAVLKGLRPNMSVIHRSEL